MTRPFPPWNPYQDDRFVCTALHAVAPGTVTAVLAPREHSTIAFDAGQYVTVEFDLDGRNVSRCYTIASPPTRPERLAITVQRAPANGVSAWLHDGGLRVGSTVQLGAPQGQFTLERHPAASYLFLTAGSGITPALSVLRQAHDLGTDLDLVLLHSQRRVTDVPYRDELRWIAATLPRVRIEFVCSDHDRADPSATAGRLDGDLLTRLVPDLAGREIFVCGPDAYRATVREATAALGARPDRVHEESFTLASDAPAPAATDAAGGFRVEFRNHGVTVDCAPGSSLLDAAVGAGVAVPFSCTQGLCGTCKHTLLSGEVDMQHAGGIRPREIAAGKILLCCSRPRSDLVIAT